jgi:peptide chain release factor 1
MYQRYADAKGWKLDLLEETATELGGYREVSPR